MGQSQEQIILRGNMNDLEVHEKITNLITEIQIKTKMSCYIKNLKNLITLNTHNYVRSLKRYYW